MEDLGPQGPASAISGPPAPASDSGTTGQAREAATGPAPDDTGKPAGSADKAPDTGTPKQAEERFLTLEDIEDEAVRKSVEGILGQREKQMMANYTKKTQALSARAQDLEIIDAFRADPVGTLTRVAQQNGLQVVDPRKGGAANQPTGYTPGGAPTGYGQGASPLADPNWQPQTYQELAQVIISEAAQGIMQQLSPVLAPLTERVERITSDSIEQKLSEIDPNWKVYEDDLKANIREHPTLIKSQDGLRKLYRLSVPEEVYTSRAVQEAMRKLEGKTKSALVGSKSATQHTTHVTARGSTFADAVAAAKEQLNKSGR